VLDFIETFPAASTKPVQERGNSLSTGQKQLINFARALAYNPRILILDEATSSVDTDTELRIRGALDRNGRGTHKRADRGTGSPPCSAPKPSLSCTRASCARRVRTRSCWRSAVFYWKLYQLQYKDQEAEIRDHRSVVGHPADKDLSAGTPVATPAVVSRI